MALLHPLLLVGLGLTAVPVILHLMLRAKPKKLIFPALRLIQNRRRENIQRLRLRHLLLLLLRIAVIALIVFAVARPRVPATDYAPSGGDWLRLIVLSAMTAAIYFGLMHVWRRRAIPAHTLTYRRSILRTALTAAGIVLFVLLVAWPYQRRISAAITQPTLATSEHIPVAAVLLFDTSLSMQYQHESQMRLDVARKIARAHVADLPSGSRIAVADTSSDEAIRFLNDRSSVTSRIDALEGHPAARLLNDRVEAALQAQIEDHERAGESTAAKTSGQDEFLREIYVFTDLATSAWRRDDSARIKEELAKLPSLNVYLIDVGIPEPQNVSLTGLSLSEQTVPTGSDVTVRVNVEVIGVAASEKTVEIYLENDAGKLIRKGSTDVKPDVTAAVQAQFQLLKLKEEGVRQGVVRLATSDPLAFDDVQYFSLRVQPPREILVVADEKSDAQYWIEALAPSELVRLGKARYRCSFAYASRLTNSDLKKYAVVCLINVADPTPAGWKALAEYVNQGGGAAILLGGKVDRLAYRTTEAEAVLPAELLASLTFNPPEFLDLQNVTHPMLKMFTFELGATELEAVEIHRYWRVKAFPDASVITRFTDQLRSPALVERGQGKGLSLLFTTGVDRNGWNDLPAVWPFLALADQMMQYLSRAGASQFNYTAGMNVVVNLEGETPPAKYLLRKPKQQQLPGDMPPGATSLTLRDLDQLGNYRLLDAEKDSKFVRGFSINADPAESRLARLNDADLEAMFGKDRYSVSQSIEGLKKKVQIGRVGREAFPLVLIALLAAFIAEHFVANRFYEDQK